MLCCESSIWRHRSSVGMNGCLAVGWGECHDECKDEPRQRMKILIVLLQSDSGTAKSNRTALFLLSCYVSLYSEFVAAITTPAIMFLVFMFSLSASLSPEPFECRNRSDTCKYCDYCCSCHGCLEASSIVSCIALVVPTLFWNLLFANLVIW